MFKNMNVGGDMMKLGMLLITMDVSNIIMHGTLKFVDLDGTIHFLGSLGLPPTIAVLMSIGEVVGGLAHLAFNALC